MKQGRRKEKLMKTVTCSMLVAMAALTAGCASTPKPALSTAVKECTPKGISADTCEYSGPSGNPNKAVCHVYVGGTQDQPVAYPYDVYVSKAVRNVTIVWTLMDPGATFRDNNDGPNFGNNAEFSDGTTTDDPSGGSPSGRPAKHYSVKFKNTPNGRSHQYSIVFKPRDVDSVRCDPTITN